MTLPVKIYFEVKLDDSFTVKPVSDEEAPKNNATHKILHLDYKTLQADGTVDVLPEFNMQVFQLGNKKAVSKIAYNDLTRIITVSYIDQSFDFHTEQIHKQADQSNKTEFCKKLEEALNEILNLPE